MATITIKTQPSNVEVFAGKSSGILGVVATVEPVEALSYQWFTADDALKTNPIAIVSETTSKFLVPTSRDVGIRYYYCTVTGKTAIAVDSSVATITVNPFPEYLTGIDVANYLKTCDPSVSDRLEALKARTGIAIPNTDKALRTSQLELFMLAL